MRHQIYKHDKNFHDSKYSTKRTNYLLAVIIKLAIPCPTIPQKNPTQPYKTPCFLGANTSGIRKDIVANISGWKLASKPSIAPNKELP